MRQCGIDGKFHGKSGRLPLCYPDRIWYDKSILREGERVCDAGAGMYAGSEYNRGGSRRGELGAGEGAGILCGIILRNWRQ